MDTKEYGMMLKRIFFIIRRRKCDRLKRERMELRRRNNRVTRKECKNIEGGI